MGKGITVSQCDNMTETQKIDNEPTSDDWDRFIKDVPDDFKIPQSIFNKLLLEMRLTDEKELNQKYPIGKLYHCFDALIAWRNELYASATKSMRRNYLAGMCVLIDEGIVDPTASIENILTDEWAVEAHKRINGLDKWSPSTKKSRRSCLEKFLEFAAFFKPNLKSNPPVLNIPGRGLMHHILSGMEDKIKAQDLSASHWDGFFDQLTEGNLRDCLISILMLNSGRRLEDVLDLRKTDITENGVRWADGSHTRLSGRMMNLVSIAAQSGVNYVFATKSGKRIRRTQVIRHMKNASKAAGLDFEITPKILQGVAIAKLLKQPSPLMNLLSQECKD